MTISSDIRTAGPFTGTGLVSVYAFAFKVFAAAEVVATSTNTSGVLTTLAQPTHYTVTLNSNQNTSPGGTITLAAPLASGFRLEIGSEIAATQGASLPNQGGWFPAVVEDALDRLTILAQQMGGGTSNRNLRVPELGGIDDLPSIIDRAGKLMSFNGITGAPEAVAAADQSATQLAIDLASTAAGKGASMVGVHDAADYYASSNQEGVNSEIGARSRRVLYATDRPFYCDNTGAVDCSAGMAAIRASLAADPNVAVVFPGGIYSYSVSPNWAINGACILADGAVHLRYTGTGNALIIDAGPGAEVCFNVTFRGNFIVEATAAAQNGVYARSIHHSRLDFNVRGCGTAYAAFKLEFAVCSEYRFVSSVNEGLYLGARPKYGIYADIRNANEQVSACTFINPIIEGASGDGILFAGALKNEIIGGTSEGNAGIGVNLTSAAEFNTFRGIDLEVNVGGDINDNGRSNVFDQVLSDSVATIGAAAIATELRGGIYNAINIQGSSAQLNGVSYASNGGAITNSGLNTTRYNVLNLSSGSLDRDMPARSKQGAVLAATGAPTVVIQLPVSGNNWYHVTAHLAGTGEAASYGAYALVYQDGLSCRIISQTNGALMSIGLSGNNVTATQTSGAAQSIAAAAVAF